MAVLSPREKRKLYMKKNGYNKLSSQERQDKLKDALRFLQGQMLNLDPEAQDYLLRKREGEEDQR